MAEYTWTFPEGSAGEVGGVVQTLKYVLTATESERSASMQGEVELLTVLALDATREEAIEAIEQVLDAGMGNMQKHRDGLAAQLLESDVPNEPTKIDPPWGAGD